VHKESKAIRYRILLKTMMALRAVFGTSPKMQTFRPDTKAAKENNTF
jgi:hypothetical protein